MGHTPHYTLHTTYYTPHTTHYTLHTTYYKLHTTHYILNTTHYTLHTTNYTLYTTHIVAILDLEAGPRSRPLPLVFLIYSSNLSNPISRGGINWSLCRSNSLGTSHSTQGRDGSSAISLSLSLSL